MDEAKPATVAGLIAKWKRINSEVETATGILALHDLRALAAAERKFLQAVIDADKTPTYPYEHDDPVAAKNRKGRLPLEHGRWLTPAEMAGVRLRNIPPPPEVKP